MLGKKMTDHEVKALIAYFSTLEGPKSPHLGTSGELNESAQRGKVIFASDKAGCTIAIEANTTPITRYTK